MNSVNDILKQLFKVDDDVVKRDLTMNDVGNWDSLTHMDLIVTIEESLEIELTGDEIAEMISFDAIRTVVKSRIN